MVGYFFPDEIQNRLAAGGFELVHIGEWMTEKYPAYSNLSIYALGKAK